MVTGGSRGTRCRHRPPPRRWLDVGIGYRHRSDVAARVVAARRTAGAAAIAVRVDVAQQGDVLTYFDTVQRELGPVSGLVNNPEFVHLCVRETVRRMSGG